MRKEVNTTAKGNCFDSQDIYAPYVWDCRKSPKGEFHDSQVLYYSKQKIHKNANLDFFDSLLNKVEEVLNSPRRLGLIVLKFLFLLVWCEVAHLQENYSGLFAATL